MLTRFSGSPVWCTVVACVSCNNGVVLTTTPSRHQRRELARWVAPSRAGLCHIVSNCKPNSASCCASLTGDFCVRGIINCINCRPTKHSATTTTAVLVRPFLRGIHVLSASSTLPRFYQLMDSIVKQGQHTPLLQNRVQNLFTQKSI